MEVLTGMGIAILGILSLLLVHSLTTLVHEYGHALPALLLTDGKVEVYVGSYGNIDNSFIFKLGRLTTYFKFNMLNWNIGMCQHYGTANFWRRFMIVLGGPIASILLTISLIILFQKDGMSDMGWFYIAIFGMSAVYDFFINMIPFSTPMKMHDGTVTYNDGQQLLFLFKSAKHPAAYSNGFNLFEEEKYAASFAELQKLMDDNKADRSTYEKMVDCLISEKKYFEALEFYENILFRFKPKATDYSTLGELHLKVSNYDDALEYLNLALHENHNNPKDLNHRGQVFIQLKNYYEATFDLNNALRLNNTLVDAYANRGLLHLRTNEMDAAKWDLEKALSLDENHALTNLHLGYFYERKNDADSNQLALAAFQKAQLLGVEERNIEWIIAEARRSVGY
ncbi:MAG: tetratricopeptide (TPR) repeat protein [Saprospiraceae bacterium]|jgi:tetratricopeptide (TPR) repeat protein